MPFRYPSSEEVAQIRRDQVARIIELKNKSSNLIAEAINEEAERAKLTNYVSIKAPLTLDSFIVQQANNNVGMDNHIGKLNTIIMKYASATDSLNIITRLQSVLSDDDIHLLVINSVKLDVQIHKRFDSGLTIDDFINFIKEFVDDLKGNNSYPNNLNSRITNTPTISNVRTRKPVTTGKEVLERIILKVTNYILKYEKKGFIYDHATNEFTAGNTNYPVTLERINAQLEQYKSDALMVSPTIDYSKDDLRRIQANPPASSTAPSPSPSYNQSSQPNSDDEDITTGNGLKKLTYQRRVYKKGINFLPTNNVRYMTGAGSMIQEGTYLRLGKFMINMYDLKVKNIISLKYVNDRQVLKHFPRQIVSVKIKNLLVRLLIHDEFDKSEYENLSEADQSKVKCFLDCCHIDIGLSNSDDFTTVFEILKGEYLSGNSMTLPKLKLHITDGINRGLFGRREGLLLLSSL